MPGPGFHAIRLTLAARPVRRMRRPASLACSWLSVTPPSRTYSKVTRSRGRSLTLRTASMTDSMGHFRLMGMISARTLSLGALRLMASLGRMLGRLKSELLDAGHDAGSGDGHALRAEADLFDQQADGGHEVVVVQERLAHAHEHQVDALAAHFDAVALEYGDHLAGDLARGQVALETELGGQAELAVDGAAHLAGDADRRAGPGCSAFAWGAVTGFAAIALRHPDGLDCLRCLAGCLDEVALGAVDGLEDLRNSGAAHLPSLRGQSLAQRFCKCSNLTDLCNAEMIESLRKLLSPPCRLAYRLQNPR